MSVICKVVGFRGLDAILQSKESGRKLETSNGELLFLKTGTTFEILKAEENSYSKRSIDYEGK